MPTSYRNEWVSMCALLSTVFLRLCQWEVACTHAAEERKKERKKTFHNSNHGVDEEANIGCSWTDQWTIFLVKGVDIDIVFLKDAYIRKRRDNFMHFCKFS